MGWYCPRCGQPADAAGVCARDGAELAPIGTHDLIGRSLGEYTVLARLGGGAFGQVFRAIHPRSGHVVAIKLLDHPIEAAESQRVITEARAAATIRHPNVVQVYDLGITADRRPFIVMEYLEGQTLADAWRGSVGADEVVRVATEVLRGLAAAHRLGVVHRDLKPANVFVVTPSPAASQSTRGARVVIVDFGLAKLLGDRRAPTVTISGASVGTPRYMSPEQIRGRDIDGRTDLYALGVMMYEAIAGEPPFAAASTFQLLEAHLEQPAPALAASSRVAEVIDHALAKDPAQRFPDADTMRRALRDGMPRRRRIAPLLFGLAALLAVTTIAIAVARRSGSAASPAAKPHRGSVAAPLSPEDEATLSKVKRSVRYLTSDDLQKMICTTEEALTTMRRRGGFEDRVRYMDRILQIYRSTPEGARVVCSKRRPP